MVNPIARCLEWMRATFTLDDSGRGSGAYDPTHGARMPRVPLTTPELPKPVSLYSPDMPQETTHGVYVWATAHGIDVKPGSPLPACTCSPKERRGLPGIGTIVVDAQTGKLGQVMGHEGPRLQLRPPQGGREWEAFPSRVRPANASDELRTKVADANHRSRQEWGTA